MKHLKLFENFANEDQQPLFDPFTDLTGNDKKVFDAVDGMVQELYNNEDIARRFDSQQMEPIITEIIDQAATGHKFPYDKQYFVFVSNWYGKKYVELECGVDSGGGSILFPVNPEFSSHGIPASYGKTVYSYDMKTGKIEYDENFFRIILR